MLCELCGNPHEGKYGSGRFCGLRCARRCSSLKDRENRNKKISDSLVGRFQIPRITRLCLGCGVEITVPETSEKAYCTTPCRNRSSDSRENLSRHRVAAIQRGITNSAGIRCVYNFRGSPIRCDSKLEYSCLDFFEKNYEVLDIRRSEAVLLYEYEGVSRRFLPDFDIETSAGKYIVEVKGTAPSQALNTKWLDYEGKSPFKKEALIRHAEENGLIPFWFVMSLHRKFYYSLNNDDLGKTLGR